MSDSNQNSIAFPGFSKAAAIIHQILTSHFEVNPEEAIRRDDSNHIHWNIFGERGTSLLIALHISDGQLYFVFDYILAKVETGQPNFLYEWLLRQNPQYRHLARIGLREQHIVYSSWAKVDDLTNGGFENLLLKMSATSEKILDQLYTQFGLEPFLKDKV